MENNKLCINSDAIVSLAEELDSIDFKFPTISTPTAGSTLFTLQDEEVKEIYGIIVDHHRVNTFWNSEYSGNSDLPSCLSRDGIQSVDGKICNDCENNKFGSAKTGKGKACRNYRRVYIMHDSENIIPSLITLPPTSLKTFSDYILKLATKNLKLHEVITRMYAEKVEHANKIRYSVINFEMTERYQDCDRIQKYVNNIKSLTRTYKMSTTNDIEDENE